MTLSQRLKAQAYAAGFDLAGIAMLGPVEEAAYYDVWLASGYAATMDYMRRNADVRRDTTRPEAGMRFALVVALDYGGAEPNGPVARYARGDDYHRLMWDRLDELGEWLRTEAGGKTRSYVDTGPILERVLARNAGLGWIGKNAMLINPDIGSFFFIGALFTDVQLEPDRPFATDHCGTCRRCLDACPTGAFAGPRVLDAARCISYLTIELRGPIPPELQEDVGAHLYGCDVCQEVCPWNVKFAREAREPAFKPRGSLGRNDARALANEWLAMDAQSYATAFRNSAMKRARLDGLQRNAHAVLDNLRGPGNEGPADPPTGA